MPVPSIETTGLSKTYRGSFGRRGIRAVDQLDLSIDQGEIFGLLGPNGAGKTTLVKMLLSIVKPTAGEARIFGTSVYNPASRSQIGYLPENHRFPDFFTPMQMMHLYGELAGVSKADRTRRIPELLSLVQMEDWKDTRIKKFSKGMMQRVGLAQALINDPQLIILDEPTDGVDPIGRREIRDVLLVLKEQGKTIFINSHLLSEIERLCTRVAIMNKGALVSEGSVDDLTREETRFTITATHVPAPLLEDLTARFSFEMGQEKLPDSALSQYHLPGNEREALNAVIDALRSANVLIESVEPVRKSLEDQFVQVIKDATPSAS